MEKLPKKLFKLPLLVLAMCLLMSSMSNAHSGRTDSNGGHYNRSTGEYHYHNGGSSSSSNSSVNSNSTVNKNVPTPQVSEPKVGSPTKISVIPTDTTITISWDKVYDAVSYEVSLNGDIREVEATSITYTNLIPEQPYEYSVRAKTSDKVGDFTKPFIVKTLKSPIIQVNKDTKTDSNTAKPLNYETRILFDDLYLDSNIKTVSIEGRVLVPLRDIVEKLNGEVGWDSSKSLITITKGDKTILLTVGSKYATVNGNNVLLDVPAMIIDSKTMVPLRFVAESLGVKVDFYKNTVIIATDLNNDLTKGKSLIDGVLVENNIPKETLKEDLNKDLKEDLNKDLNKDTNIDGSFVVTSPVSRNEIATLKFKGEPNTLYDIDVHYSTTISTAQGLENKTSDSNGNVEWTWKIGGRTNPGTFNITVKGNGKTYNTKITVE